jgi:hypothetical protein
VQVRLSQVVKLLPIGMMLKPVVYCPPHVTGSYKYESDEHKVLEATFDRSYQSKQTPGNVMQSSQLNSAKFESVAPASQAGSALRAPASTVNKLHQ